MVTSAVLPPWVLLDPLLRNWLTEDIGRGDVTADSLFSDQDWGQGTHQAHWVVKSAGVVAGLPIAARVFSSLDCLVEAIPEVEEGEWCDVGTVTLRLRGPLRSLLTGERTALNIAMRLSGIATTTREYVQKIADLPAQLVDTRKTTPGLRLLEKYASRVGGAANHRMGLDDAAMIKDNHIAAAGGIKEAITQVRAHLPYPLTIEVETESLEQVKEALEYGADIIMLDNMPLAMMRQAVKVIRASGEGVKVKASGNVTIETIRSIAETGVDYISSSAPVTRSAWLDLSMRMKA